MLAQSKKICCKNTCQKIEGCEWGGHLYTGYYVGVKTVIVCAMAVIFLNSVIYFCYDKTEILSYAASKGKILLVFIYSFR